MTTVVVYVGLLWVTGFLRADRARVPARDAARESRRAAPRDAREQPMSTDALGRGPARWCSLAIAHRRRVPAPASALGYGLPAVYNPDEVAIMNRALGLGQNDLNPHNFLYPTLYFYALFVWEGLWFVVGRVAGVFDSLADFERAFFVDPTSIYLAGRAADALVAACRRSCATWRLGARLFGRTAGVGGRAAARRRAAGGARRALRQARRAGDAAHRAGASSPLAVGDRRRRGTRGDAGCSAGALAGLAMSTHYYAVFLAVPWRSLALLPAAPSDRADERVSARVARSLVGASPRSPSSSTSPFLLARARHGRLRDIVANRADRDGPRDRRTSARSRRSASTSTWLVARTASGVVTCGARRRSGWPSRCATWRRALVLTSGVSR